MKSLFRYVFFVLVLFLVGCTAPQESEVPQEKYETARVLTVEQLATTGDSFVDKVFMVQLKLLDGDHKGETIEIEHQMMETDPFPIVLKPGDEVVLYVTEDSYFVDDYKRENGIYILIALFVVAILWVGRWQGVKTVVTLLMTMAIISFVHIPLLNRGVNPLFVTIAVATLITILTLFFVTGVSHKSAAAVIGTLGGVIMAGVLALLFAEISHITGLSNDEALMLKYIPQGDIFNASELLLSGIILGALGAVMDVAMSIASSIEEIRNNNPQISIIKLFRSGMTIGRDIMGTMTNTLILAYTGSFLPLILLFNAYQMPRNRIMNMDLIAAEVLRALSGSIGIVMCIPITAFVSVQFVRLRNKKMSQMEDLTK
ncbi:MAG: YibE/F family protein [Clostridiales bacterium]|nr:MAG: YibE/F family protein [Clostridiales bacterium]